MANLHPSSRKGDGWLPSDLELVVLKTMQHSPKTAAEVHAVLDRFHRSLLPAGQQSGVDALERAIQNRWILSEGAGPQRLLSLSAAGREILDDEYYEFIRQR